MCYENKGNKGRYPPLGVYVLENTNQTLIVSTREEEGSNHRKWRSCHREPVVEWTFIPGCLGKLDLHHCPGIVINSTPAHSEKYLCFDNKLHNHPTYKEILLRKVQDDGAERSTCLFSWSLAFIHF